MSSLWGCWSARSKKRRPGTAYQIEAVPSWTRALCVTSCELAIVDNSALQHSLARET